MCGLRIDPSKVGDAKVFRPWGWMVAFIVSEDLEEALAGASPAPGTPSLGEGAQGSAFPVSGWDRYQHVGFLGQGGMGRVFLAYDPRLRRQVALKFVRDDHPELTHRFLSEARAQAKVNHERVCKVYEVGQVDQKAFIAMQYVEGQPLGALVHASKRFANRVGRRWPAPSSSR